MSESHSASEPTEPRTDRCSGESLPESTDSRMPPPDSESDSLSAARIQRSLETLAATTEAMPVDARQSAEQLSDAALKYPGRAGSSAARPPATSEATERRRRSRSGSKSPYKCTFCDEALRAVPFEGLERLRLLTLVQRFQCPHCFTRFLRPLAVLSGIPGLRLLFTFDRQTHSMPSLVELHQADCDSSFTKRVAKFGKWVQRLERRFFNAIKTAFVFVSSLLIRPFGRRSRGFSRSGRSGGARPMRDPNKRNGPMWRFLRWLIGNDNR